jgi:hypothetical protein
MSGVLSQQGSWIKPDLLNIIQRGHGSSAVRPTVPRLSPRVQIVRARSAQKQIYVSDSWNGGHLHCTV